MRNNTNRAITAHAAINNYSGEGEDDFFSAASDLLCDLLHYLDRVNLDFGEIYDRAFDHYCDESDPESGDFGGYGAFKPTRRQEGLR